MRCVRDVVVHRRGPKGHDASEQRVMKTSDLEYDLPAELIATRPTQPRDAARLLVAWRSGGRVEHRRFAELPSLLEPGDLLVFNVTSVTPARIRAARPDTGGRVDGLFLEQLADDAWLMKLRSNGKLRPGMEIELLARDGTGSGRRLRLAVRRGADWVVSPEPTGDPASVLGEVGLTPLPPYILRARGDEAYDDELDRAWYQTVYADPDRRRSVAAPTAGLHFTDRVLERLEECGVEREAVTLDVGAGTFQPVAAEVLEDHPMHAESIEVRPEALAHIRKVRDRGARAIAVGTTSVRALESISAHEADEAIAEERVIRRRTDLLIAPGYEFRWIDGMITNFHLPRSTLLALVAAMLGVERLHAVYREAIRERYRFYSYGDAMLILP